MEQQSTLRLELCSSCSRPSSLLVMPLLSSAHGVVLLCSSLGYTPFCDCSLATSSFSFTTRPVLATPNARLHGPLHLVEGLPFSPTECYGTRAPAPASPDPKRLGRARPPPARPATSGASSQRHRVQRRLLGSVYSCCIGPSQHSARGVGQRNDFIFSLIHLTNKGIYNTYFG